MATNGTPNPYLRLILGLGVGALTLIGMIRLVAGNFDGRLAMFAWVVVALTMIPWVAYCGWRGWHGRLTRNRAIAVAALVVGGLIVVWLFVLGPVIALLASLAAFALIWISDWPGKRVTTEEKFVRLEELGEPEYEDEDVHPDPEQPHEGVEAEPEPEPVIQPEAAGYEEPEDPAVEVDRDPPHHSDPDPGPDDPRLGRVADQSAT
ncbi:hypothetical protein [Microlunatus sp. GCM10028923]|uniref:hypothetical protein n=1 Tax=Microlunatus sp. GCM10028923 TaxID=3273400 RepID=UPI00361C5B60